jgi:o-succinylbenzoate synthase
MDQQFEMVISKIEAANFSIEELDSEKLVPKEFPSISFAFETALLDLKNGGSRIVFENEFIKGKSLPINGLIWMGGMDFMLEQISRKIEQGFQCIKIKVGGLNFERECDVLGYIRSKYFDKDIMLRLDANGAFKAEEALNKLKALAEFNIHSIEQPIKQGLKEMAMLCKESPIPIALDEELTGVYDRTEKETLLKRINPQYIILKPTLHGGFKGCDEWIALAESLNIKWWITSALESNIGLNAICQFTEKYNVTLPQGLGTGMLYENNFPSPLEVAGDKILYNLGKDWKVE